MLIDMFLTRTATITPFIRDGDAEPIYGTPETRKCRIQRNKHMHNVYVNPSGSLDEVTARGIMFCRGEPIPPRSLVDVDNEHFVVVRCNVETGFADHHLEVTIE